MAKNRKTLQDFHIDLAIYWTEVEGLTLSQIVDRFVAYFGEELRVTYSALSQRIQRRKRDFELGIKPTKAMPNPEDLTDTSILDWFRALLYEEVYIAKSKSDTNELRKSVDTALKVMRAKKDLTNSESDEDKAAQKLLKEIQKGYNVQA